MFTGVCLSTGESGPGGGCLVLGGVWSRGAGGDPLSRTATAAVVRILLECILVVCRIGGPPRNDISIKNILISSPDLGSPPKFRLE